MAQAILSRLAIDQGVQAEIASVGLLPGGHPVPPETQDALAALAALGYNDSAIPTHRSRQLSGGEVASADLVLGLARDHVREVVVQWPEAWARTFTLKELVRRGGDIGPRGADEELKEWLARVSEGRDRRALLGSSNVDDVVDPIGGPPSMFEQVAGEIQGLCVSLTGLVWPVSSLGLDHVRGPD
jgi:protein-tyrosine phosphatase